MFTYEARLPCGHKTTYRWDHEEEEHNVADHIALIRKEHAKADIETEGVIFLGYIVL